MFHSRNLMLIDSVKASHEALVIHAEKMTKLGSKVRVTTSGWQDNKAVLIVGGIAGELKTFHIDANNSDSAFAVMAIIKKLILESYRQSQPTIFCDYAHVSKPKKGMIFRLKSFFRRTIRLGASVGA